MKSILILFSSFLFLFQLGYTQCLTYNGSTLLYNDGNGTCTYDVTLTVNSGNGAIGDATFSIEGEEVYVVNDCVCNPSSITFPITIVCDTPTVISLFYNAPGNGNDCSGTTSTILLPVEWLNFEISSFDNEAQLTWSTASEINNAYFEVERSADSRNWNVISDMILGSKDPNQINDYTYLDKSPQTGLNYYRVKQTDLDGNFSRTDIKRHVQENLESSIIFPNPVSDKLFINSPELMKWTIYTPEGVLILSGNSNEINTYNLLPGQYILNLYGSNRIEHLNFIKI